MCVTRTEIYRDAAHRLSGRIRLFVMGDDEGVDIDSPLGFTVVRQWLLCLAPYRPVLSSLGDQEASPPLLSRGNGE